MKKLFCIVIFFFLAFPVFAADVPFLTNQNGTQTTQFEIGDSIYIEGICLPANDPQVPTKVYIAPHKAWQINEKLYDVSGGIETLYSSADGKIPHTLVWNHANEGAYDFLIDTNSNMTLEDWEKQCIISGFTVGNPTPPPPAETTPPSPPPASTPPPAPALSTKPSVIFSIDEYIETKSLANIRKSPGGTLIGSQEQGASGVVVGGPVQASVSGSNYWFWNINFENDPDGWIAASMIKSAPAPAPAPAEETVIKENITGGVAESMLKSVLTPALAEGIVKENVEEPLTGTETTVTEEMPQEKIAAEKMLAQVSGIDKSSGLNQFMDSIIIGAAIFFGLISSSVIIARTLRKNKNYTRHRSPRPPRPRRSVTLPVQQIQ